MYLYNIIDNTLTIKYKKHFFFSLKKLNTIELVKSGKYSILYTTLGDKVCQ